MNKSKNNVNRDRDVNYRDKNNNFIKRCGYLLAAMKISDFIKFKLFLVSKFSIFASKFSILESTIFLLKKGGRISRLCAMPR